jgi:arginine-tRNA-protein transferase
MFVDVHCPDHLTAGELDAYLAHGWFRMGQTIFTTNWLNFKDTFYSAIWLRIQLNQYSTGGTEKKVIQKNAGFRTEIRQATITIEKELLFFRYKQSVPFEASSSLHALLFGNSANNIFDTQEVNVYHDDKLIAVGYFDLGNESAMGIASIYDPDYKKYSLGKFLIYLKIKYCIERGMKYFYPGYFVPGYRSFDYKLDIGTQHIEFLELKSGEWWPISGFTDTKVPVREMMNKLTELKKWLARSGVESEVLFYDYFYANQTPELSGAGLLDFPLFLSTANALREWSIIVFDVRTEKFHLLKCYPVLTPPAPSKVPGYYSEYVLKSEDTLFASQNVDEIGAVFNSSLKPA